MDGITLLRFTILKKQVTNDFLLSVKKKKIRRRIKRMIRTMMISR